MNRPLPVPLAVQPETKTDVVDPEATPKTGAVARVSIWAGCIATRLRVSVLPSNSSCLSHPSIFILIDHPDQSLDSLGSLITRRCALVTVTAGRNTAQRGCPQWLNVNSLDTAGRPTPDDRARFPAVLPYIGERLPGHPGRRPLEGDHFRSKHDTASPFKHLKSSGLSKSSPFSLSCHRHVTRDYSQKTTKTPLA